MPISALPSPYGIGTLGQEGYTFADFVKRTGCKYWQVLPVGPTSYGDSPYQSFSAFAGNPYYIDLDYLISEGLLEPMEVNTLKWQNAEDCIDYAQIYQLRFTVLKKAFHRSQHFNKEEFLNFCKKNEYWLKDYSIYMAVKGYFGNKEWLLWDEDIKLRRPEALKRYTEMLEEEINFWEFCQYKFREQWDKLKYYANKIGIQIVGDIPLYVSTDSSDVWVHGNLFELDERKNPINVAGVPPDTFSDIGQRWGNPLYRWDVMEEHDFAWWRERMKISAELYDIIRIDHFIGIVNYYSIPAECPSAVKGEWKQGPGKKLTDVIEESIGEAKIIAEDLGAITSEVRALINETGYAGMKILEFGLGGPADHEYLPHNYIGTNMVAYTGTHDNETLVGYLMNKTEEELEFAYRYFSVSSREKLPYAIIRALYSSNANVVVVQMQDLLLLDNTARMNFPSTIGGNWLWRMKKSQYEDIPEEILSEYAAIYARAPKQTRVTEDDDNSLIEEEVMDNSFKANVIAILDLDYQKTIKEASTIQLYNAVSKAAMKNLGKEWGLSVPGKKVCYLSAEFLIGRLVYSNLYNMGLFNQFIELMSENNLDIRVFEDIEDAALGNGGLGRLAACFLDSGATIGITLNGYGIRYKYGLFKQYFEDGFQKEIPDDWQRFGDPWSIRKEDEKVLIHYKNQSVYAVPYDTPVIGYGDRKVNTLRLWQAEPLEQFNFELFNEQKYDKASKNKNEAEAISSLLYPNDSSDEGKKLRLKQEYFFSAATLQDVIGRYKKKFGEDFSHFSEEYAIQLNDTHPVVAIPELIRLFVEEEKISFTKALRIAKETFAYTNHTVMSEALEKWNAGLFKTVIPAVYKYVVLIHKALIKELKSFGKVTEEEQKQYLIIDNDTIHMARLAIYATHSTNGVAKLHTEILKNDALKEWYELYPERFNNKTNGITQRRWLALANMELAGFISDKIGNSWLTDLDRLKDLEKFANNKQVMKQFGDIKRIKKRQLADYIYKQEKIRVNPDFIFDIQVKRLHEYKRQLLNAFSILDIYFGLKDGRIKELNPTAFIFGAKAAPGYYRAKGIIKFLNEIAKMMEQDQEIKDKLQVIFVHNYNVSYAEKLTPAADISEQISTAGTEASGTGNMKFMLNGAVTLGTYDGANVEIVEQAGEENNYIFGARVEDIEKIKDTYNPRELYEKNPRIKKVLDTLVNGTFDDGKTGMFEELYNSILNGASWHKPDYYYLLLDFIPYCEAKLQVNRDYSDTYSFRRKCFLNTANAGKFSSDRSIRDYANEIWN